MCQDCTSKLAPVSLSAQPRHANIDQHYFNKVGYWEGSVNCLINSGKRDIVLFTRKAEFLRLPYPIWLVKMCPALAAFSKP